MTKDEQAAIATKAKADIDEAIGAGDLYEVRVIRRKPCPACGSQRDYDAADDTCMSCYRNMDGDETDDAD